MTNTKQDFTKYLIYAAIALLIINFLLIFLPFIEIYQPSYSKTTILGDKTYEGWYTQSAPMASFIFPIFLTGIPYLCSIVSLLTELSKKNGKNIFIKIKNNKLDKPLRFFWLKFASIANAVTMWIVFVMGQSEVEYLEKYGAYCHMTFFGILNVICTVAFMVVLFVLSHHTKLMFTLVNKEQATLNDRQFEKSEDCGASKENIS